MLYKKITSVDFQKRTKHTRVPVGRTRALTSCSSWYVE